MTLLLLAFFFLFGALLGVLLGLGIAAAPYMPTCALCGHDLPDCTCYGPGKQRR